jgi:MFS transporter, FSR family, fosmidomycin resistance protein
LSYWPVIGIGLNGTSSVLYGTVPELVAREARTRAFGIFYTGTAGASAVAPPIMGLFGDRFGVCHRRPCHHSACRHPKSMQKRIPGA